MTMPALPRGFDSSMALIGPNRDDNPYKDVSWVFQIIVTPAAAGAIKIAQDKAAEIGLAVMKQAFLNANIQVPRDTGKAAWQSRCEVQKERVAITRSGDKLAGDCFILSILDSNSCFDFECEPMV